MTDTDLDQAPDTPTPDTPTEVYIERARKQILFWGFTLVFTIGLLFLFRSILLPFVAGMALAYFLDPVADRLEKIGMSRIAATSLILIVFILLFIIGLVIILPILAKQISDFITRLPEYLQTLQTLFSSIDTIALAGRFGIDPDTFQENFSSVLEQGAGFLKGLVQSIWSSGKAIIDIASVLIITPVVAFYMLLDWDKMVKRIDDTIPRDHLETVRGIAAEMDRAVAGFIRGQGTVSLLLGTYYAVGLTVVGLNFGLLIGMFAGVISFIPYVGSMIGLILALGVALVQFWPDYISIIMVVAVFFSGQFLEGNILQPKLVGERVGLHPVWLMFALFAFGALFGFVGLLIAVPAAAAVGVLVRFFVKQYLNSPLYSGHD